MAYLLAIIIIVISVTRVHGTTMDEVVRIALENNFEVRALRVEEEVAKGQLEKAQLLFGANPAIERSFSRKDRPDVEGGGRYTNYGVKLSQEFEIAGQRGLRIELAKKNLSKVLLEVRDKERMLVYEVKDRFARALALKKKEELTRRVVGLQEELLNFTRIRYSAGSVSGLEVTLAEVELGKAKKDLLSAERESKESLLALQGVIGLSKDAGFTADGELSPYGYPLPDKEVLKERAAASRPDIMAASLDVDRSLKAIDLVKREVIPNITLGGFYNKDEQRNETGITASVSIPLFNRKQAEKAEAQARASQAKIRRAGLEKGLEREIEDAYSNLAYSLTELDLFKKEIVTKSLENLNLLNFAFKEGKISFFDVRIAQKDTLEIQFSYLDTTLRAQRWIYAIERAAGGYLQ
jgi:outer membrane protein, heavy metal efflux system